MFRICVLDFGGQWDDQLPLIEFAYNNSYHSNIGMAPYEGLYGRKCRSPLCWTKVGEAKVHDVNLVQHTSEMIPLIKEHLKTAFSKQKSYANPKGKDIEFIVGGYVFLKVSPMNGSYEIRK